MKTKPNILLVEANEADEILARKAIAEAGVDCDVRTARDGIEACRILFDSGEPPPTLILLELDLPKLNGFEVLTRIRSHDETKRLTVIIFSASGKQADINRCFDLHANSYVQKDQDLDCYETRLKLLLYYWIAVNRNGNA